MARILKLLWRLDYQASYQFLDARGKAVRAMTESVPKFWDAVRDGDILYSYVGQRTVRNEYTITMSLEQSSLNGSIDWYSPRQLEQLGSYEEFRNLNTVIREILKECDVKAMTRAGVRPICTIKASPSRATSEFAKRFFAESFLKAAGGVGAIEDVGVSIEGITEDAVAYRMVVGPLRTKNINQYLANLSEEQISLILEDDLFFDIDVYEQQISFLEHSFYRWSETKLAVASALIEACQKTAGGSR